MLPYDDIRNRVELSERSTTIKSRKLKEFERKRYLRLLTITSEAFTTYTAKCFFYLQEVINLFTNLKYFKDQRTSIEKITERKETSRKIKIINYSRKIYKIPEESN